MGRKCVRYVMEQETMKYTAGAIIMNKKFITLLGMLLVTAVMALSADAQTEKRIAFGKGKSSATVRGNTGSNGTTYVIRARSGQKIMIDLSAASKVGVKVESNGRDGH